MLFFLKQTPPKVFINQRMFIHIEMGKKPRKQTREIKKQSKDNIIKDGRNPSQILKGNETIKDKMIKDS